MEERKLAQALYRDLVTQAKRDTFNKKVNFIDVDVTF